MTVDSCVHILDGTQHTFTFLCRIINGRLSIHQNIT